MFVTDRGIFIWYSTPYQLLGHSPVPSCPTSSTSQSSCRIMYADRCILSCPHYLLHHLQMHVFRLFRDLRQMKRFGLQYWCSWKLQRRLSFYRTLQFREARSSCSNEVRPYLNTILLPVSPFVFSKCVEQSSRNLVWSYLDKLIITYLTKRPTVNMLGFLIHFNSRWGLII